MSDDELLYALAAEARREADREREALDERWDRLAAGDLSPAEEAGLAILHPEAYEAFRPLGADFQQRVVQALQAAAAAERAPAGAPPGAPGPAVSGEPGVPGPAGAPSGRLLPFHRRRWVWTGAGVAAVAAASVVVFSIGIRPALPDYTVQVQAGEARLRGGAAAAPETAAGGPAAGSAADVLLSAGDSLVVRVRPETPVTAPIEARWFAARRGEVPRQLRGAGAEGSSNGAVRLSGTVGHDLDLTPGVWSLWVMVGRTGALPDAALLRAAGAAAPGWTRRNRDWRVWRVAGLRVEGDGAGSP
jgi:hypothetical protein